MSLQISPPPVRKSIHVAVEVERAFKVFTGGMTRWWKPEHHLGSAPLKAVMLEPRVDGRWYEVMTDGAECTWGKVLAWEPPSRIVLGWQIDADWKHDPDFLTEVEVRFFPEGDGTRVELEHRNLDQYGERSDEVRAALDSEGGWQGGLVAFATVLHAEAGA